MAVRILVVGDVVGKPGRRAVSNHLHHIVDHHNVDFICANGENLAGGIGITPATARELLSEGVSVITTGNHVWRKRDIYPFLDEEPRLLRPANYPDDTPGRGAGVFSTPGGVKVGVLNIEGRVFMKPLGCPFRAAKRELELLREEAGVVLVDFHAEATSEKQAMGWFLDGLATAVVGTHTHVQTADERVLPRGTAYITDVGFTGSIDSVIGMKKDKVIRGFLTLRPESFEPAGGQLEIQAVLITADEKTGGALDILRIREKVGP